MPEQMHKSVASESAWAREFKGWLSLFHQGFFFFSAHTLSCQTLWAAGIPAYLFIYYPGALRMQPGLLFYYFILFFFLFRGRRRSSEAAAATAPACSAGLSLGRKSPTSSSKKRTPAAVAFWSRLYGLH